MKASACEVEWDDRKNQLNQKKHHIAFEEAATIFADPFELTISDAEHSKNEHRFISIGKSLGQRLLVVSYT
jgi:uncharacterized protein